MRARDSRRRGRRSEALAARARQPCRALRRNPRAARGGVGSPSGAGAQVPGTSQSSSPSSGVGVGSSSSIGTSQRSSTQRKPPQSSSLAQVLGCGPPVVSAQATQRPSSQGRPWQSSSSTQVLMKGSPSPSPSPSPSSPTPSPSPSPLWSGTSLVKREHPMTGLSPMAATSNIRVGAAYQAPVVEACSRHCGSIRAAPPGAAEQWANPPYNQINWSNHLSTTSERHGGAEPRPPQHAMWATC